ncbi:hypothetical protein [Pseudomonas sp. MHK4]
MLAKNLSTPRGIRLIALSLTTIASKLAPTVHPFHPFHPFHSFHLIRIFQRFLTLLCIQPKPHNDGRFRSCSRGAPHSQTVGGFMGKMAFFLGGFLVLTILIGVLATISPV